MSKQKKRKQIVDILERANIHTYNSSPLNRNRIKTDLAVSYLTHDNDLTAPPRRQVWKEPAQ